MLQRAVYIRNTYKFRLSWEYCLLDPMDLVTVTDSILGLSNAPIRITEIEEDENGFLQRHGGGVSARRGDRDALPDAGGDEQSDQSQPRSPIRSIRRSFSSRRRRWPAPPRRSGSRRPAAPGGVADPNWGGCNRLAVARRHVLQPDRHRRRAGAAGRAHGVACRPSAGTNPDTRRYARGRTWPRAAAFCPARPRSMRSSRNTLCIVDCELVSYATATLTSANQYALTSLYRGLYGTAVAAHSVRRAVRAARRRDLRI